MGSTGRERQKHSGGRVRRPQEPRPRTGGSVQLPYIVLCASVSPWQKTRWRRTYFEGRLRGINRLALTLAIHLDCPQWIQIDHGEGLGGDMMYLRRESSQWGGLTEDSLNLGQGSERQRLCYALQEAEANGVEARWLIPLGNTSSNSFPPMRPHLLKIPCCLTAASPDGDQVSDIGSSGCFWLESPLAKSGFIERWWSSGKEAGSWVSWFHVGCCDKTT